MSLLTEKGTGQGSKVFNITVRAWIVLFTVLTGCLNSTAITLVSLYAAWHDKVIPVTSIEPTLTNIVCVVIGYYFGDKSSQSKPPQQ